MSKFEDAKYTLTQRDALELLLEDWLEEFERADDVDCRKFAEHLILSGWINLEEEA